MIRRGELSLAEAKDGANVAEAIEDLLDRALHGDVGRGEPQPETNAGGMRPESRRDDSERRGRADRRTEDDRRHIVRMWSELDADPLFTPPDRRTTRERRGPVERRNRPSRHDNDDPGPP